MRDSNLAGLCLRFGESNGELFATLGGRDRCRSVEESEQRTETVGKDELAILLLSMGGVKTMGDAVDFIIHLRS
ncbi:hypothetical protein Bca52824_026510 [Brassica carinata]|uniref:Uncharacterized protein n=1 Tax=Brassica carinata TaxID=52824 RepID=A0A8X7SIQ2_BRACI|nr:hypothetical protein Bca52824_026510 [Brassica carinata]